MNNTAAPDTPASSPCCSHLDQEQPNNLGLGERLKFCGRRTVRLVKNVLRHHQQHPVDIIFHALALGTAIGAGVIATHAVPALMISAICYIPPPVGFAGYPIVNAILGAVPAGLISFAIERPLARDPKTSVELRQQGTLRRLLRGAAKLRLLTLAGIICGGYLIPTGLRVGLFRPFY